mgnify:CR=1 FL=1|jgi:hypothetical protein
MFQEFLNGKGECRNTDRKDAVIPPFPSIGMSTQIAKRGVVASDAQTLFGRQLIVIPMPR